MHLILLSFRKVFKSTSKFNKVGLLLLAAVMYAGFTLAGMRLLSAKNTSNKITLHHIAKRGITPANPVISYSNPPVYKTGSPITPLSPVSSGVSAFGYSSSFTQVASGLNSPKSTAVDAAGNVYVADSGNNAIVKIPADNSTPVQIGIGFNNPAGVAVDAAGNVYVADASNNAVEKILAADGSTVSIGTGFTNPVAVTVDAGGNVFVVQGNGLLFQINASDGSTAIISGSFNFPTGVAVDSYKNIYVSDGGGMIWKLLAGKNIPVQIGGSFDYPSGITADGANNIFFSEENTHTIYEIPAGTSTAIAIASAGFDAPEGLAVDKSDNLYVADVNANTIQKLQPNGGYFIDAQLPAGLSFDVTTGIISGTPTVTATAKIYNITAFNSGGSASAPVTIEVDNPPAPVLSYTNPTYVYTRGTSITPVTPLAENVTALAYGPQQMVRDTGFNRLSGVAVDKAGNLYVTDDYGNSVKKIPADNGPTVLISSAFSGALGIAVDKLGNIFVADYGNSAIYKIAAGTGTPVNIGGNDLDDPNYVTVDDAGNVYFTDDGNEAVYEIPANGGERITLTEQYRAPEGIAVDGAGNVYVTDAVSGNVYKMPPGGGNGVQVGHTYNSPVDVKVDGTGNVFIVDQGFGSASVELIPGGTGTPVVFNDFYSPSGVAIDNNGNFYVSDYSISKYNPVGGFFINPGLPRGLTFNGATGAISGKPTVASSAADYTVHAYNYGGSVSAVVNVEIDNPPAPALSYAGAQNYKAGFAITPLTPTTIDVGAQGYNTEPVTLISNLNRPYGTAVDATGNVYFADAFNRRVMMLPAGGGPAIELGAGNFGSPAAVTVDAAGNIYVADSGSGQVTEMPPGGGAPVSIGSGFIAPNGLAVDGAGNVYVTDPGNGALYKICAASGNTVTLADGFSDITGVAVDGRENLYFTDGLDQAVYRMALAGGIPFNIGCHFNYPSAVAVDNSGNVFVTDRDDNAVYRITRGGNKQVAISHSLNQPGGISVDVAGNVYVGDTGSNTIRKLTPSGGYFIDTTLPAGLKFSGTTGTISGTPTAVSPAKDYKITAYSYGGSASATVSITVSLPPVPTVSYAGPQSYAVSRAITPLAPASTDVAGAAFGSTITLVDTGFNFPFGLGIDRAGNKYVANAGNDTLYMIPAAGGPKVVVGSGFTAPVGVTFDGAGNIYVADAGNSAVKMIPAAGGTPVAIGSGFDYPASVAADADGNVYVADEGKAKVFKIAAGTHAVTTLTSTLAFPTAVAVDGNGSIYVADEATYSIYKFAKNSHASVNLGYNFAVPVSITVDAANNIYVADIGVQAVEEIPAGGGPLVTISGFTLPYGVATDGMGNLYVTDIYDNSLKSVKAHGGYYISPALPAGLSFDGTTGIISGTPAKSSPATDYTVNAFNFTGSVSANVNIKVLSNVATLTQLLFNSHTSNPVLGSNYRDYTLTVKNVVSAITIGATATDSTSVIKVNGVVLASKSQTSPISLNVGQNTINTVVTSADGTVINTYSMVVTREASVIATLSSLTFNPYVSRTTVSGPDYKDYTATVSNTVSSIAVTLVTADTAASVTVNGLPVISGASSAAIHLNVGDNIINTVVTAGDGITKNTYSITINRKPSTVAVLISLAFNPNIPKATVTGADYRDFTSTVNYAISSVMVIPVAADSTSTIKVNGQTVTSGTASTAIALNVGVNIINTVVTAGDGITKNTYSITITRQPSTNAILTALNFSPFISRTTISGTDYRDYTATVNSSVSSITVSPVTADNMATVTVNGELVASGAASNPIALNLGNNQITTVVTAPDGLTQNVYQISILRGEQSSLAAISSDQAITPVTGTEVTVHQGVSPNSDGRDDFLLIDGITAHPDNTLQIMNRSGSLVYEARGYDNSSKIFDGHSSKTGKLQQPGTYFYSLSYKAGAEVKRKTGFIVLKY